MRPGPTSSEFRAWCREARRLFPISRQVRVRRVVIRPRPHEGDDPDGEYAGEYWYDSKRRRYEIRIDRRLDYVGQTDALLHEWAHCLMDDDGLEAIEHTTEFWDLYGSLYRVWNGTE